MRFPRVLRDARRAAIPEVPEFWSVVDNLTPAQRSLCMSRVRGRDTGLERLVRSALHRQGFRFRKHVKTLPGRPDIVFPRAKVVVFIDGDFWHGYRFPLWEDRPSPFWKKKIRENRLRDRRNFRRLRSRGWRVKRIWQHEIELDPTRCVDRIVELVVDRGTLSSTST